MSNKDISAKTGVIVSYFPSVSETFVVNQIVAGIDHGMTVSVLARKKLDLSTSAQPELLDRYNLLNETSTYLPEIPEGKLPKLLKALALLIAHPTMIGVFIKTLNKKKYGLLGRSLKLWFQAVHFRQFNEYSLFHAHFGINGIHIARMHELNVVNANFGVSFHGYDAFAPTDALQKKLKEDYRVMFKRATFITANTPYLKSNLLSLGCPENKIHLIAEGFDPNSFEVKERKTTEIFKLVTVGRLIPLKGHRFALHTVKELIKQDYKVHYTLVGSGESYDDLVSLVNMLELEDYITMIPEMTQKEIQALFHKNDLFLMTSVTDEDGRAEAQGLVSVEAQATGLPVVAFNSGGVSETLIDGSSGFLVPEKDVSAMVDKIKYFIDNPEMRNVFGLKGSAFVRKKFDCNVLGVKMVGLYKQFL